MLSGSFSGGDLPYEAYLAYMGNPVRFIEDMVYGIPQVDGSYRYITDEDRRLGLVDYRLEPQTKGILDAVARHDYVAVHSGRGCTKTTSLAFLCIWFIITRPSCKIVITGPKFELLQATIWSEVNKWLGRSLFKDKLKWSAKKMYHLDNPGGSYAQILTSREKENIQGVHDNHVLWLLDEASNIEDGIYDAIYGGMTDPEAKIVLTGNLTKTSGFFYRITQIENQPGYNVKTGWHILHYSSADSARKNKRWFNDMRRFPPESDMWRVYVLGLPPSGSPRAIISIADAEAARKRDIPFQDRRRGFVPLELGLDPAAEGNDLTAIAIRFGKQLLEVRTFSKQKAPETVLQTLKVVREYRQKYSYNDKIRIKVDDTAYGNAIRHYLALNDTDNIEVVGVNFGAGGNENYADNATIMWFNLADIIGEISLPDDNDLIEQLASREWVPASKNRMRVEPKAEYKRRLSTGLADKADAAILAFWDGTKKIFTRKPDAESNIRAFDIDWRGSKIRDLGYDGLIMENVWHFAALVLNRDISVDGVCAVYEYYNNRLWVYKDFHYDIPIAEVIKMDVVEATKCGFYTDEKNVRIIGNAAMFKRSDGARPFGKVLKGEGLQIKEPTKYDEYGAIALGVSLFRNNGVIMHRDAFSVRQQFGEWTIKDGKPDKDGFGCCEAALIIFSEIKQMMKTPPPALKVHGYRPVVCKKEEGNTKSGWMRR